MELNQHVVDGVIVVEVAGRIDSTTAPALHERLTSAMGSSKANVLLDLGRLDYISSAGFRVLLLAAKRAEQSGTRIALCGLSGKVSQLFDLAEFLDLFSIAKSRDEGLGTLR